MNWIHQILLKTKANASKEDNPNWWEAVYSPFPGDYRKTDCKEVETLEKMGVWEIFGHTPEMNVLELTWESKIKRFPSDLTKKYKARFCAWGDHQLEGVDYFETYTTVVQWNPVRLMLILELILDIKSKQGKVIASFMHTNVPEGEHIYVAIPRGFICKLKVLKL